MTMKTVAFAVFSTVATVVIVAPAFAADRFISDAERSSNTYRTYSVGSAGCVEDLGYGRLRDGCE
jgi:hypothetical protein